MRTGVMPAAVLLTAVVVSSLLGCSSFTGRSIAPGVDGQELLPEQDISFNLPALPSGALDTRHASLVDSDNVNGAPAFDSHHATVAGATSILESLTGPGDTLAYAIYQIAARPAPNVPYGFNINAYYFDPTPVVNSPGEGYYVAYSNYAQGHWIISSPTTNGNARVILPAGLETESPGGFIYVAVIADQGVKVRVFEVSMGYYTVPGELEDVIAPIPGDSVGRSSDIQVSPDGDVQIAYLHGPAQMSDTSLYARVAKLSGGTWETEAIPTTYNVSDIRFALGSGHRRALLLKDESTFDLHLFFDGGSGSFGPDVLVEAATKQHVMPALIFINSADVPAGPQDLALVAYAAPAGGNIQTKYYTYNGAPVASGNILPPTTEPGAVTLTHDPTGMAFFAVPIKPLVNWELSAAGYSAVTDTWSMMMLPLLDMPDISGDQHNPSIQVFGGPGGTLAAYARQNPIGMQFNVSDGLVWTDLFSDRVFCVARRWPDVEQLSPTQLVFATRTGNQYPVIYIGSPGSGTPWTQEILDTSPYSGIETSVAVDSTGVIHVASQDATLGALRYYRREPGGSVTTQIADAGSMESGIYFGPSETIWVNGQMHVFGADISHFIIRHSVNEDAVWTVENEPLPVFSPVYMIMGAGYLPDSDTLYVVYFDFIEMALGATYGPPDGSNWQTKKLVDNAFEYSAVADNGTNLGLLTVQQSIVTSGPALFFTEVSLSGGPAQKEEVFAEEDLLDVPWTLDYSPDDSRWYAAFCDGDQHVVYAMRREAPLVWSGPSKIAEQYGTNGEVRPWGATHAPDGTKYVVVSEEVDATGLMNVRIYSAPPGSIEFHPAGLAVTYDLAGRDVEGIAVTPGPGGQPAIAVMQKLIAATTWDITIFMPDGSGLWPQQMNIDSSILGPMAATIGFGFDLTDLDQPLISVVEGDDLSSNMGRIMTYYPF